MNPILSLWRNIEGQKTYLASSILAVAGLGLLLVDEGSLGVILLANGSGLAALRHALARLQQHLEALMRRWPPPEEDAES